MLGPVTLSSLISRNISHTFSLPFLSRCIRNFSGGGGLGDEQHLGFSAAHTTLEHSHFEGLDNPAPLPYNLNEKLLLKGFDRGLPARASSERQFSSSTEPPHAPQSAEERRREQENRTQWEALAQHAFQINPCNSKLHPAVITGVIKTEEGEELSVQEAYVPNSRCFGCGPSHPDGLHLRSYRVENGLEATVSIPAKYCAFPGIINGGIISCLMDCHGNWSAAISLMDKGCLPKPPLTLTASMFVTYKEPTPPDTPLLVRSQIVSVKQTPRAGVGKSRVEVEVQVLLPAGQGGGAPKLLVQGMGVFKRLGALRAL